MKLAAKAIITMLFIFALAAAAFFYLSPAKRADWHFEKAQTLKIEGDVTGAVAECEKALQILPVFPECRYFTASLYRDLGNYTKAEYHLNRGIELSPGRTENYTLLSLCYAEQDKLFDAVALLEAIEDPVARQTLQSARPKAPELSPPGGAHHSAVEVTVKAEEDCQVYLSIGEEFPSIAEPFEEAAELPPGETRIRAVAVSRAGLVSPVAEGLYSVDRLMEETQFEDAGVEQIARALLSMEEGAIYTNDLWKITNFENVTAEGETIPVRSLADFEHFRSLRALTIADSPVDLSTMPEIPSLEVLSLTRCALRSDDLKNLPLLPRLYALDLSDNRISSVAGLVMLPELTELNLRANGIAEISPLMGFSGLKSLDIGENAISDIQPVTVMRKLTNLSFDENRVQTIRALSPLTELLTLDFSDNQVSDLSPLAGLIQLTYLNVSGNRAESLSPLENLTALRELYCDENAISSLAGISYMPLITFSADSNRLRDLSPLSGMANLEVLSLGNNGITSLEPLSGLLSLKVLRIEQNAVKSIAPLSGLTLLTEVHISGNDVPAEETLPEGIAVYR